MKMTTREILEKIDTLVKLYAYCQHLDKYIIKNTEGSHGDFTVTRLSISEMYKDFVDDLYTAQELRTRDLIFRYIEKNYPDYYIIHKIIDKVMNDFPKSIEKEDLENLNNIYLKYSNIKNKDM
jgi:hypothetical protein